MNEQFRIGDRFQKVGKENFDAVVRACGEANKSLQAIAAELTIPRVRLRMRPAHFSSW